MVRLVLYTFLYGGFFTRWQLLAMLIRLRDEVDSTDFKDSRLKALVNERQCQEPSSTPYEYWHSAKSQ